MQLPSSSQTCKINVIYVHVKLPRVARTRRLHKIDLPRDSQTYKINVIYVLIKLPSASQTRKLRRVDLPRASQTRRLRIVEHPRPSHKLPEPPRHVKTRVNIMPKVSKKRETHIIELPARLSSAQLSPHPLPGTPTLLVSLPNPVLAWELRGIGGSSYMIRRMIHIAVVNFVIIVVRIGL